MKIDEESRYKHELNSFISISCCTKVTESFFQFSKSSIFGRPKNWSLRKMKEESVKGT